MDELLDRLKLLHYQRDFCQPRQLKPFHRLSLSIAPRPLNDHVQHLVQLGGWLLNMCGSRYKPPTKVDDLDAVINAFLDAIKVVGITLSPDAVSRFTTGYGDFVVRIMIELTDKALQAKHFKYQKPIFSALQDVSGHEEAEVDEEAEVTVDTQDKESSSSNGYQAKGWIDQSGPLDILSAQLARQQQQPIEPVSNKLDSGKINVQWILPKMTEPSSWQLEVERVTPLLKIQITNDHKDWRLHQQQMTHHHTLIHQSILSSTDPLSKLLQEIEKSLDKIHSREKYIHSQFESLVDEHRHAQEQLSDSRHRLQGVMQDVQNHTMQWTVLSEQLDRVKMDMDDLGSGMTDPKPLVQLKQAMTRLKADIKLMDLRMGVVQHLLLHAKLRDKGHLATDLAKMKLTAITL